MATNIAVDLDTLECLGETFELPSNLLRGVKGLVCSVYGSIATEDGEMQFRMFYTGSRDRRSPPLDAVALCQHVKHANYQAAMWKRSCALDIGAPSTAAHG